MLRLNLDTQTSNLEFWPVEIMNGGVVKAGSLLKKLKWLRIGSRIKAGNIKELKALIRKLSKDGAPEISQKELKQLEKLVEKFGGKIRKDMKPVERSRNRLEPHVQVEGLGKSV